MKALPTAIACLAIAYQAALAQTPPSSILRGVDSVDARVVLTWDEQLSQPNEATIKSRLQTVLELELRRLGIVLSLKAPNYLEMRITVVDNQTGLVAYSYEMDLIEPGFPNRILSEMMLRSYPAGDSALTRRLRSADSLRAERDLRSYMWDKFTTDYWAHEPTWVTTWSGPTGVAMVGKNNLQGSLERKVVEVAQVYANTWMASRPQPRR